MYKELTTGQGKVQTVGLSIIIKEKTVTLVAQGTQKELEWRGRDDSDVDAVFMYDDLKKTHYFKNVGL